MAKRKGNTEGKGNVTIEKPARKAPTQYDEETKRRAVSAMLGTNRDHPYSNASLNAAYTAIGDRVSNQTLEQWFNTYNEDARRALPQAATDVEIVKQVQDQLVGDLSAIQQMIIGHIKGNPKVLEAASLRDSMVSLGIASDKIEAWLGMSAGARERWNKLQHKCAQHGLDPYMVFDDFIASMDAYYTGLEEQRHRLAAGSTAQQDTSADVIADDHDAQASQADNQADDKPTIDH